VAAAVLVKLGEEFTITQIQPDRKLLFEILLSTRPHGANLLHCRSPFSLCLEHV
jgi:hypothetical protein